jgi:hypothetical protein
MKTRYRNKVTLLLFALTMTFSPIMALGQGIYSKKTTPPTTTATTPTPYGANGPMLRAEGNGGDDGNPDKIEDEAMPLSDGLYLLLLAGLGYGLFIWRKGQKRVANLSTNK